MTQNDATPEKTTTTEHLVHQLLSVGLDGRGPFKGVEAVTNEHLHQHGDIDTAIARLIATHSRTVAASGFVTGLGGLITLPLTVPTDVFSYYVAATRCVGGIAHLRGYDIHSEEVRSIILLTLLGSAGKTLAQEFGIQLSNKTAMVTLQKVPGKFFIEINRRVGFRLITRGGTTGLINVSRWIPVVGGVTSAGINVAYMRAVGSYAKANFPA